jgi:Raf kinase inhibitor-like YbhB/YbcL family protein
MRKWLLIITGVVVILGVRFILGDNEDTWICREGVWVKHGNSSAGKSPGDCGRVNVFSPAWEDGGLIPKKYTCDGENVSPPLSVAGMPEKAVSWMLVMHDPDAPPGDFAHWAVWNINPQVTTFSEGAVPEAVVEGKNDFGKTGYGGPCPPAGRHHYLLEVMVLDKYLEASRGADLKQAEAEAEGHIISRGQWVGVYR